jgi:hypothetical protein
VAALSGTLTADLTYVTDLEFSHAQLQAALTHADKEIRKLTFGKRETQLLALIRRVLYDAEEAAGPLPLPASGSSEGSPRSASSAAGTQPATAPVSGC